MTKAMANHLNGKKKHFILIISLALVIGILLTAIAMLYYKTQSMNGGYEYSDNGPIKAPDTEGTATADGGQANLPQNKILRISMVGDLLLQHNILEAGRADAGKNADFSFIFRHIQPIYRNFDINILDLEGVLVDPPFSGNKFLQSPKELAEDMRVAGINMVVTANYHAADGKEEGVDSTVKTLDDNMIQAIGTTADPKVAKWSLKTINDINVGFTAYTLEDLHKTNKTSLNDIELSEELQEKIDSFSFESDYLAKDKTELAQRVEKMKKAGAELIVFVMHWGNEYNSLPSAQQQDLAQFLTDSGVDLILACGANVVQPVQELKAENSEHKCLVYYSLGNFVSAQYFDTNNTNGRLEDGLMAMIEIQKEPNGNVYIARAGYMPFYCYKPIQFNGVAAQALPHQTGLENLEIVKGQKDLLLASATRINEVMQKNTVTSIPFALYPDGKFVNQ